MKRSKFLCAAVLTALSLGAVPLATAQTYPNKPLRVLVGFTPGGGTDSIARVFAKELAQVLAQPVVAENRPGANGMIATNALVKAAPDGYTIMLTISSHVTNGLLYPKISYDPMADIAPISVVATVPFVLTANPALKANDVQELLRLARSKPGDLSYGSAGSGSPPHLFQELMNQMADVKTTHVPYKGSAPAMTDLLGNQISLLWLTTVQSLPFLKDGRLKAFAVSTSKRSAVIPNVPTLAEAGVPGYDADMWWGFIAPKGTPPAIVDVLQAAFAKIVASPSMREQLVAQGAEPVGGTPAEFWDLLRREHQKWGRIVRERNIRGGD